LGALKSALRQTRREADEMAARQREQAAREARERNLFALTVGTVVSLPTGSAAHLVATPRPPAEPRQRQRDEAAVMVQALSDEFDVDSLLETDDSLSFRRRGIGPEVVRKLRRGVWVVQAQLDLHGLRRDQARERLSAFLHAAQREGLRCLRVIHGKGNGSPGREPVLKVKVRSWLVQRDAVIAFTQARAAEGGAGALIVLLASARPARGADKATRAPR
ncbi:MAG: Smr/MutS family protein, partial [Burkholderiaceae bacterium]